MKPNPSDFEEWLSILLVCALRARVTIDHLDPRLAQWYSDGFTPLEALDASAVSEGRC